MIDPAKYTETLNKLGVTFFTGVPDSLLKNFCAHVMYNLPKEHHVITANEGASVGLAIGYYLRTAKLALVYLQNSGFGNTVNPLISLADPEIYGIPMLLLIGWRGQPGVKDEPQHIKQGRVMTAMLDSMEIPWAILPKGQTAAEEATKKAVEISVSNKKPYVLLIEKDSFDKPNIKKPASNIEGLPSREEALIALTKAIGDGHIQIATTGMLSRELFEYRQNSNTNAERDFLTVGGMGHCSSIALGIAMQEKKRETWCLDGDGALIMHMGSLPVISQNAPENFFHVIFNNGVHDSVGGQPTSIDACDLISLAKSSGYRFAESTSFLDDITNKIAALRKAKGPSLLELKVRPGNREDIGRPTHTPSQAKEILMKAIG